MKQELPIAVALLAGGCLLWFSQSSQPTRKADAGNALPRSSAHASRIPEYMSEFVANQRKRVTASEIEGASDFNLSNEVAPASYQVSAIATVKPPTGKRSGFGRDKTQTEVWNLVSAPFVHAETSPESLQFLTEVTKRLAASKPFHSTIRLTGTMFGKTVSATGNYHQMGQGTSKSRIQLDFAGLSNVPSVLQLCDGRFVYKLQSDGDVEELEFIDLTRIRKAAGEQTDGITPTGWIATGGISSLFQHLASDFNFGDVEVINESTIGLRGSWDDSALKRFVATFDTSHQADIDSMPTPKRWNAIPVQLPHAVELIFRKEPGFHYFPNRVSFKRFVTPKGVMRVESSVTLEISSPKPLLAGMDRLFVIDSSGLESLDTTDRYIARIKQFERTLQAAATKPVLDR